MFYFSVLSKENNHLSAAPMSFCLQNDRAIRESPLRRSRAINENLQAKGEEICAGEGGVLAQS
jgi:hypothetical protein